MLVTEVQVNVTILASPSTWNFLVGLVVPIPILPVALSILNETGYEVCDYFFTNGSIDLPRSTLKSRALKFPRMILNKISPSNNAHFLGGSSMMILAKWTFWFYVVGTSQILNLRNIKHLFLIK